jgi:hypothetical protein
MWLGRERLARLGRTLAIGDSMGRRCGGWQCRRLLVVHVRRSGANAISVFGVYQGHVSSTIRQADTLLTKVCIIEERC